MRRGRRLKRDERGSKSQRSAEGRETEGFSVSANPRAAAGFVCLALGIVTLIAFSSVLGRDAEFLLWDDGEYVAANPQVQAGLTADSIAWAFTTFHASNWHPLTWLSLQLDADLHGLHPWGFHLTNILLHAGSAMVLFLSFWNMTAAFWRSALVAALFALHPLRVESVAWIAERKDVLSTFFWMLTLAAYCWYVRGPGVARYLLVLATFGLGLMAKSMLVTLPCVLLLLDYWPLDRLNASVPARRDRARRGLLLLLEKLPLFVLAAAASVLTVLAQEEALGSFARFPLETRLVNSALAYAAYLGRTLWPSGLCPFYSRPAGELPVGAAIAAGTLTLGLTAAALWFGRRWRYLAVGWLWYVGTLVPVIGLVQVGVQTMADRYTYIPQIGLWIALVWGLADLWLSWVARPNFWLPCGAALILLAFAVETYYLAGLWQHNVPLWQHAVEVAPNSYGAQENLGVALLTQRRAEEAVHHFHIALQLEPDYAPAHTHLANALMGLGQTDEAIGHFRTALQLQPNSAHLHLLLARALKETRQWHEALTHVHEALRLEPHGEAAQQLEREILANRPQP